MAIEVHIPRDIDEYQPAFMLGLRKKHFIYVAISAAVVVPNVIWGNLIMPSQLVGIINILMGAAAITPMILDAKSKGVVSAEEQLANFFHFFFSRRLRHYEHMDYIADIDQKLENKRYEKAKQKHLENSKKKSSKKKI